MLLLLVAGYYSVVLGGLATMASDSCRSSSERPICGPTNQQIVALLPAVGLVVGLLVE